jgi:2'-5' RNA ligase
VASGVSLQAGERALIVTLKLDEASFDWLQALRTRWFPAERNIVPAHLTLFHNLPGGQLDPVRRTLREVCARQAPVALEGSGPRSLGRGVAFGFRSPALEAIRGNLAQTWAPWLTPQDRQSFRPHVTVQNKVEPAQARALLETLQAEGEPFDALGEGVLLWRYHGGPWEAVDEIAFGG